LNFDLADKIRIHRQVKFVVREAKPHRSIYVPPPGFGKTGMSRNRLDDLTKCLRLCERPEMRPPGMSSEKYDSYSASVATAQELKRCRLRSIGVVKTVTKRCPLAYLFALKLHDCGDRQRLVTRDADGQPTLLSFVWMDGPKQALLYCKWAFSSGRRSIQPRAVEAGG
jgi:hypothetical protein